MRVDGRAKRAFIVWKMVLRNTGVDGSFFFTPCLATRHSSKGAVQFCRSPSRSARTRRAIGTYLRTQSVAVGVSARYISAFAGRHACVPCQATTKGLRVQYLRASSCTHDSAGARMLIRTRNACTFAPSVAPSARMTLLHDRLVRSGQRGAGNIALEPLQMPRQYTTRIFSCMLAPFVAPSPRMTLLHIDLMRADNMLRATWRWNYSYHGNTPLAYTQRICGE